MPLRQPCVRYTSKKWPTRDRTNCCMHCLRDHVPTKQNLHDKLFGQAIFYLSGTRIHLNLVERMQKAIKQYMAATELPLFSCAYLTCQGKLLNDHECCSSIFLRMRMTPTGRSMSAIKPAFSQPRVPTARLLSLQQSEASHSSVI